MTSWAFIGIYIVTIVCFFSCHPEYCNCHDMLWWMYALFGVMIKERPCHMMPIMISAGDG